MKHGDIREKDGFMFWGLERKWYNKAEYREKWLSPSAFAKKKAYATKFSVEYLKARKAADPVYKQKLEAAARQKMRERWATAPKKCMVTTKRAFCKKYALPFELTEDDFEIPEVCPLLKITLRRAEGMADDSSPELDRIIPSRGYVKGNVWVISRKANRIKTNASIEEIRMLVQNWPF